MTANCTNCMGNIDARNGAISTLRPSIEEIFPDAFNVDLWNLAAISPLTRTYRLGVHKGRRDDVDLPYYAAYAQDDWHVSNRLTLNLGVRYDLTKGSFAQQGEFLPFMQSGRPEDADNVQPRLGFAYQLNDRTVLRGGAGKYYAEVITPVVLYALEPAVIAVLEVANDGRPDFAANPFNGPAPTFDEAVSRFCSSNTAAFESWRARNFAGAAPCVLRGAGEMAPPADYAHVPQTWQATAGFQRQLGSSMAVEADYVYSRGRDEKFIQENVDPHRSARPAVYPVAGPRGGRPDGGCVQPLQPAQLDDRDAGEQPRLRRTGHGAVPIDAVRLPGVVLSRAASRQRSLRLATEARRKTGLCISVTPWPVGV
jgi:opacity protein-like surface antigen